MEQWLAPLQTLRTEQDLSDMVGGRQQQACQETVPLRHVLCRVGSGEGSVGDSFLCRMFPRERVGEIRAWWYPTNPPTSPLRCAGEDREAGPHPAYCGVCQRRKPASLPPSRGSSLLGT